METVDLDYLEDLIELAKKHGVAALKAGSVEVSFGLPPGEAANPIGFVQEGNPEVAGELVSMEPGPHRGASLYDSKLLFPAGKPAFPVRNSE